MRSTQRNLVAGSWYRGCCKVRDIQGAVPPWRPRSHLPPDTAPYQRGLDDPDRQRGSGLRGVRGRGRDPALAAARANRAHPRPRDDGRPQRVAFTRKLERGSLGYTLEYSYDPIDLHDHRGRRPSTSNVVLSGEARFVPLSARACLMLYRLVLDLPIVDDLVSNELDGHPASLVVAEFREHLRRLC